jgi:predicted nucleic acid-binding protein
LYAYIDEDDGDHEESLRLLESHPGPLLVPQLVIAEVTYLIETRLGWSSEVRFLGDLASGNLITEPVHPGDWMRIAELIGRYRDLPLATVDASVIALAERLGVRSVATLDRRHFTVVRPKHVPSFELLP